MAQFGVVTLKKFQRGERIGTLSLILCTVVLAGFIALFSAASALNNSLLNTVAWSTAPPLLVVGAAVAAYCNIKFGGGITRMIKKYVTEVFVENAAALRPEKNSLSFAIEAYESSVEISVNGGKEKIVFDFSPFKKFTSSRRNAVLEIISNKLTFAFCRLYERGGTYVSVDYFLKNGFAKKPGKRIPVIVDGVPDPRAMKLYLKEKS